VCSQCHNALPGGHRVDSETTHSAVPTLLPEAITRMMKSARVWVGHAIPCPLPTLINVLAPDDAVVEPLKCQVYRPRAHL
jgi:hypothetical protein